MQNFIYSVYCTHTVPVARTDCGGAAVDEVALVVAVVAVSVKPVVLEVVAATVVVVFCCNPKPTSNMLM
jgi:hypothetical protein